LNSSSNDDDAPGSVAFISEHRLFGLGIGYVDAHLLAATRLTEDAALWTRDQRLRRVADRLELAASLAP
jgi:hypothetical protein